VEAESHSLGTLIFLAADEFIVHDNCIMMFHNFSGSVGGKGHEQKAQLDATISWFTEFARKLYVPFLTEKEFDDIVDGKDLWIHSEDIRTRLKVMVAALEKEKAANDETKNTSKPKKKT
jgi:ATP-dependent protease ClpP protease subunit